MLPIYWAKHLPEDLHQYCGTPLRLVKGLYGYFRSGRNFWEEQAIFFTEFGLISCDAAPALWYKHYPDGHVLLILQYSDDLLFAATCDKIRKSFVDALSQRFEHTPKPVADWYLQARIIQHADHSFTLDQFRYNLAIVRRYLPNAPENPSEEDAACFIDPLPSEFVWTKEDNSAAVDDVKILECEFGFKYREVVGSMNYLVNTAVKPLFAIRKACKFMYLPGRKHFVALHHMLHHLRCHPPGALRFYSDARVSPLGQLLQSIDVEIDPMLVYFTDSSFQDCDEQRSTGCYLGFYQGGLIDPNSFVPPPIAMSSAEAENNTMCVGTMAAMHTRMIIMQLRFGNPDHPYTVPVLVDSQAADAMTLNEKDTKCTHHIEHRWQYTRYARHKGDVGIYKCDGKTQQLADVGTKNLSDQESAPKMTYLQVPVNLNGDLLIKEG